MPADGRCRHGQVPGPGASDAFGPCSRRCCSARRMAARKGPQPPCGKEPAPPYPAVEQSPAVKVWSESEFGRDWRPPACTGWAGAGFASLITTVARFRYTSGAEGLLRHIGAISELSGMRYWSTTHKQWRTLILDARAMTQAQSGHPRPDFTPA